MKKIFYIFAFGFLGLLLATLVHGFVEIFALDLIFGNAANANNFWWQQWGMIHSIAGTAFWLVGLISGLYNGNKFWAEYGTRPGAFGWRTKK
jgi:hypothetical protein